MNLLRVMTAGLLVLTYTSNLNADMSEIVVDTPSGKTFVLEVMPEESFLDVLSKIEKEIDESTLEEESDEEENASGAYRFSCSMSSSKGIKSVNIAAAKNYAPRDYYQPTSPAETKDIAYIVNSMGHESLKKLLSLKSSLKKAGARVNNVHPLRFMLTIYSDEEMKVSMMQMQDRSWVWKEFINNMSDSFNDEANAGNIKDEHVVDFANKVGISADIIFPPIRERRWKDFVITLIKNVPRKNAKDRYGM